MHLKLTLFFNYFVMLFFPKKEDERSYLKDLPFGSKLSIFETRVDKEHGEDSPRPERNADQSPYVNPYSGYVAHPAPHAAPAPYAPAPYAPAPAPDSV